MNKKGTIALSCTETIEQFFDKLAIDILFRENIKMDMKIKSRQLKIKNDLIIWCNYVINLNLYFIH